MNSPPRATRGIFAVAIAAAALLSCRGETARRTSSSPPVSSQGESEGGDPPSSEPLTSRVPAAARVIEEKDADTGARRFIYAVDDCRVAFEVTRSSAETLALVRHSACAAGLEEWRVALESLTAKTLEGTGFHGKTIHLAWGRLASGADPVLDRLLSERLALAVRASKSWDRRRGQAAGGKSDTEVVRDALEGERLFPELAASFATASFDLRVAAVEKVLVGHGPAQAALERRGVAKDEQLPFDAMVYFTLTKKPAAE